MIRRLGESDRASVMTLLSAAPQLNLYILGNLHTYGFDADFCEYFGDVEDGHLRGLVNRYATGWTVFGEESADWAGLGTVVDSHGVEADRLQDNPGGIESFLPFLKRYVAANLAIDDLMELPEGGLQPQYARDGFVVRKATMDDLAGLIAFFTDAGEMSRTPASTERPLRDRRVWIALQDDEIISAALTNAETDTLGMIGGVYTVPAWRGLGLSQAVCSGLCAELIATGRQPVLYWDNPAAGRVYAKLGFRKIGTWRSVRLTTR